MKTPSLENSLAAAFAAVCLSHRNLAAGKPFTLREAFASSRSPIPTDRFQRHCFDPTWDSPTCETGHPDAENYLIFSDNSIYVGVGFGLSAAPHTLSSLAAAVEARRKDGSPLPPALRELLIHVVSAERGCWTEAETDTALLLLAAADRDARLKAV